MPHSANRPEVERDTPSLPKLMEQARAILTDKAMASAVTLIGVNAVRESQDAPTAHIFLEGGRPVIEVGTEFMKEHAYDAHRFTAVLFHELLHKTLEHFGYPVNHLWNIATDAYINALIYKIMGSAYCELFRGFYPASELPHALLRNGSRVDHPVLDQIYRRLYRSLHTVTIPEIVEALTQAFPKGVFKVPTLLGSHPTPGEGGANQKAPGGAGRQTRIPEELLNGFKDALAKGGQRAGLGGSPYFDQITRIRAIKSNALDEALQQALIKNTRGEILKRLIKSKKPGSQTVIPTYMGRREIAKIAAGHWPVFFPGTRPDQEKLATDIYLDTSGSMYPYLEFAYGLVVGAEKYSVPKIHLFSTQIFDITKDELKQGFNQTTGGTSFDVVIDHMVKTKVKRALILTDGVATLSQKNRKAMKDHGITCIGAVIQHTGKYHRKDLEAFCNSVVDIPAQASGR